MAGYGPYILLDDQLTHSQRYYTQPIDIVTAKEPEDIHAAFAKLMNYHEKGYYIAGYTSYELGLIFCLLYTSPSPRDGLLSRMPSSA